MKFKVKNSLLINGYIDVVEGNTIELEFLDGWKETGLIEKIYSDGIIYLNGRYVNLDFVKNIIVLF